METTAVNDDYSAFFRKAMGREDVSPYPYQTRLATGDWPDLLDIPTGLGKTAAVVLAWLYKRRTGDTDTPRRLIYCLPMRVLVEQIHDEIVAWLKRQDCLAMGTEQEGVSVYRLMGGETDLRSWTEYPERDMILIGTQDMLLSRALMRGYGMSRYRWPVDFALLHNDALWVFDEIQLMGAGLPTSTQLEAWRRLPEMPARSRSLWISATLNPRWLGSIDFRPHMEGLRKLAMSEEEKQSPPVSRRREAVKRLSPANVALDAGTAKGSAKDYLKRLADEILEAHAGDAPTLVILNNVQRSQGLYRELAKRLEGRDDAPELILVHSRFRQAERGEINRRILALEPGDNVIVVATQAVEAGVDISSRVMFTELAPWSSLVQRFGRCNRAGEYREARVYWLDIASGEKQSAPYTDAELDHARQRLHAQKDSVAVTDLLSVESELPLYQVIRRKDFLDLFNTDPDLSGFDIDISPWIRDGGTPPVWVYWREFGESPDGEAAPARDELCPVSIGQVKAHLKKLEKKQGRAGFVWDALARQWNAVSGDEIRPGMTLLLRCRDGGYDPEAGFTAGQQKQPVLPLEAGGASQPAFDDDRRSLMSRAITLAQHLVDVQAEAERLCDAVGESRFKSSICRAAQWHDVGKSHRAFQTMLLYNDEKAAEKEGELWAKSGSRGKSRYVVCGGKAGYTERPHFRHEMASLLAWLEHGDRGEHHDLIAYLIAAHHGKVRMGLRALPDEQGPGDSRRFARGVWDGDMLPAMKTECVQLPQTMLRLDIMELGDGAMGPSWSTRTRRLLMQYGPFRLAWMEAMVRIADWRASSKYDKEGWA